MVFLGLPSLLTLQSLHLPKLLILLAVTLVCLAVLRRNVPSSAQELWSPHELKHYWPPIVLRLLAFAAVTTVYIWQVTPVMLFALPRQRPWLWVAIMLLYPFLSAYPQEIIYRSFFFHRYRPLFRSEGLLLVSSAVFFGFLHIIYRNPVAIGMALLGGLLFSSTYLRSKSIFVTSFEHALYGMWIFTVGLGHYFFTGFMR